MLCVRAFFCFPSFILSFWVQMRLYSVDSHMVFFSVRIFPISIESGLVTHLHTHSLAHVSHTYYVCESKRRHKPVFYLPKRHSRLAASASFHVSFSLSFSFCLYWFIEHVKIAGNELHTQSQKALSTRFRIKRVCFLCLRWVNGISEGEFRNQREHLGFLGGRQMIGWYSQQANQPFFNPNMRDFNFLFHAENFHPHPIKGIEPLQFVTHFE